MAKTRDPKCKHYSEATGRVAWPTGMPEHNQPHASTTVCPREECREDAARWVEQITGTRGQFVPFTRPTQPQVGAVEPDFQMALFAAATSAKEA